MADIQIKDFLLNDYSSCRATNAARRHVAQAVAAELPNVGVLETLDARALQQIRRLLIAFEVHARQLMGLTEPDPEEQKYIDRALKKHASDEGNIRIDERSAATSGHRPWGAYVQAWTWVDNLDASDDDNENPGEDDSRACDV